MFQSTGLDYLLMRMVEERQAAKFSKHAKVVTRHEAMARCFELLIDELVFIGAGTQKSCHKH